MDRFIVRGNRPLAGRLDVSGAKNSALPAMAAALLTEQPVRLTNVPSLRDVATMGRLLAHLGCAVETGPASLAVTASGPATHEAPYDLVRTMRASFLVLGPLLARLGRARVSLPGGCAIGSRPVTPHLHGLAAMGAEITVEGGYVEARADRLRGASMTLDIASVTATENLMMAACLADGATRIANAAREPEIVDLAELLNAMGGAVHGGGTDTVTVEGVRALHGAEHALIPDRIEAGTFLILSLLTGGGLRVRGARRKDLQALEARLVEAGARIDETAEGLRASGAGRLKGTDVVTLVHPGFPTDLQAQWMTLMTLAEGTSVVRETLFENRFQHVPELTRMGADVTIKGGTAVVRGVPKLTGAPVMLSDLRAGAALVLAALAAEGTTTVHRVYHLDRGYERLEEKLRAVGADIERVRGPSV